MRNIYTLPTWARLLLVGVILVGSIALVYVSTSKPDEIIMKGTVTSVTTTPSNPTCIVHCVDNNTVSLYLTAEESALVKVYDVIKFRYTVGEAGDWMPVKGSVQIIK